MLRDAAQIRRQSPYFQDSYHQGKNISNTADILLLSSEKELMEKTGQKDADHRTWFMWDLADWGVTRS